MCLMGEENSTAAFVEIEFELGSLGGEEVSPFG